MPLISSLGLLNALGFGFSSKRQQVLAFSNNVSSGSPLKAFKWNGGFQTKYIDPVGTSIGTAKGIGFNPSGNAIVMSVGSPLLAFRFSDGFGTKYIDSSSVGSASSNTYCKFGNLGNTVIASTAASPYIAAFPWTNVDGFGARYSNPATLLTGASTWSEFNPSDSVVLCVTGAINAYGFSSSGFGTKFANPTITITGAGLGCTFNPLGNVAVATHLNSPFVTAYIWDNGFGGKYSNPATLPATVAGQACVFSRDGTKIAVTSSATPYINVYAWDVGFGTRYSDPATLPTGITRGVRFGENDSCIAMAHNTAPLITAYPWSNTGFGTKYANPATILGTSGQDVSFLI